MISTTRIAAASLLLSVLLLAAGCAKNPVTGKNELMLVSEQWELDIGKQHYEPMRQSQGGDFVVYPEVEEYVNEVGQKLAAVSDRKLPYEFNVINDSTPNAWALPGGKISINRGLLVELESEAELAAVLGHEIVHAAAKHGARAQTRGVGLQLFAVGTTVGLGSKIGGQAAQMVGNIGAQLVNQSYGRKAERESDEFGMLYMKRAGYDLQGAIGLQQKFVKLSQARGGGPSGFQKLFSSHPPSGARVAHNRETMARLGTGGATGQDRYAKKMARTRRAKPAYDNLDKARQFYNKGEKQKALTLVKRAIKLEPNESLFHSALGDMAMDKQDYGAAKKHFDRAISLNNQYFYYYLRRGDANYKSRDYRAAKGDLSRSNGLLPTAAGYHLLGDVAKRTRDRAGALANYKKAAEAGGDVGKSAYSELVVMDLSSNPGAYIRAKAGITERGTLGVQLSNPTPRSVNGIAFSVTDTRTGKTQRKRYGRTLPSGKATVVDMGFRMTAQGLANFKVSVLRASVAQ